MEEIEAPTEHLHEEIQHHAEGGSGWISKVALSSALLAVLAAVAALLSADHANEAMIEQLQSSDQWSYYQAKGIKSAVLASKLDLLSGLGKPVSEADQAKLEAYKKDQENISERAHEKESASAAHLRHHVVFARAVTMFQIAIALAAISILTRRRWFGWVEMVFTVAGLGFLVYGFLLG